MSNDNIVDELVPGETLNGEEGLEEIDLEQAGIKKEVIEGKTKGLLEHIAKYKDSLDEESIVVFNNMKEVVKLQIMFNNMTNGECWIDGVSKHGKDINWGRCISMETAELMECLPWKHWKAITSEPNIANMKIEIVDIIHFLISDMFLYLTSDLSYIEDGEKVSADLELLVESAAWLLLSLEATGVVTIPTADIERDIQEHTAVKIYITLIDGMLTKTSLEYLNSFKLLLQVLAVSENFTWSDIIKLYIGKNALNTVRQQNGYLEGSYVKMWFGAEDNVYMQTIIADRPITDIDYVKLVVELNEVYRTKVEINRSL